MSITEANHHLDSSKLCTSSVGMGAANMCWTSICGLKHLFIFGTINFPIYFSYGIIIDCTSPYHVYLNLFDLRFLLTQIKSHKNIYLIILTQASWNKLYISLQYRPVRLAESWLKLAEKHGSGWNVVREKHCSGWKKKPNKPDIG